MSAKRIWVNPNQCIPMKELVRTFYSQSGYFYLKKIIKQDGFNEAYAPRAITNRQIQKYEIFDGIHRTMVAQDLRLHRIPIQVESISRIKALEIGYKANRTHEWYNTIDKAKHFQAMIDSIESMILNSVDVRKRFPTSTAFKEKEENFNAIDVGTRVPTSTGSLYRKESLEIVSHLRPENGKEIKRVLPYIHDGRRNITSIAIKIVSEMTGENAKTIKCYVALLKLPEHTIKLIGDGKLQYTIARELSPLLEKYYDVIDDLADECIANNWSCRELERKVKIILSGRNLYEFKACQVCGSGFGKDHMSTLDVCPKCMGEIKDNMHAHGKTVKSRDVSLHVKEQEISFTEYALKKQIAKKLHSTENHICDT